MGDLLGGILSYAGTLDTNSSNQAMANANNAFSAQQFATRYQTTVKDLQAAGLNPMLAYTQGGGSPPTGTLPPPRQNAIGSAVSAYQSLRANDAQVKLNDEQAKAATAQAEVSRTQALANIATEAQKRQDTNTSAAAEAVSRKQLDSIAADIDLKKSSTLQTNAQTARTNIETLRAQQEADIAAPEVAKSKTWWGRNVSPYIRDFSTTVNTAASAARVAK